MYHFMPAGVPVVGLPKVGYCLSGAHLPRLREPLYPYVCDSSYGGFVRKPQECG